MYVIFSQPMSGCSAINCSNNRIKNPNVSFFFVFHAMPKVHSNGNYYSSTSDFDLRFVSDVLEENAPTFYFAGY